MSNTNPSNAESPKALKGNYDKDIWGNGAFPNKVKDEEDIVIITRQDISIIVLKTLGLFIVFLGFLFTRIVVSELVDFGSAFVHIYDLVFYLGNSILLLIFTIMFHNYYLSMQIITSERIIDIDQTGLFVRQINELYLRNIQDVTYKQTGPLALIFGFGNVIIQTSSADSGFKSDHINGFVFENVPTPKEITATINNLYLRDMQEDKLESARINASQFKNSFNPYARRASQVNKNIDSNPLSI